MLLSILTLTMVWSSPFALLAGSVRNNPNPQQVQLLIASGREQLSRGQPAQALKTWQEATKLYRQLNDQEGITASLVYQNFALQKLGLNSQACEKLVEALKLEVKLCEYTLLSVSGQEKESLATTIKRIILTPANLLALQSLGETLRLNYKLNQSEIVLEQILSIKTLSSEQSNNVRLSVGNTKRDIYKQLKYQYNWVDEPVLKDAIVNFIPQKAQEALTNYQLLAVNANTPITIKVQAQLNCLDLLLDFQEWLKNQPSYADIYTEVNQQVRPLINLILQSPLYFSSLPTDQSIQARLKFTNSLSKISDKQIQLEAIQYAQDTWELAKNIKNLKLEPLALGLLAKLNPEKSLDYLETALTLAQSIHAEDVAYELQVQLAKLYENQGKVKLALTAYRTAIENITKIRYELLSSNSDLQFFFYEKVDPVYRNYMKLLAASNTPDLDLITQIHEQLQTAELEDYLKCGKLELVSLNKIESSSNPSAIINILDLFDHIEVIVKSPGQPPHHHSVDAKLVIHHANALLNILQDKRAFLTKERVILSHSQLLYQRLIAPLEQYLPKSGTLVFVMDKSFQSLPVQVLHDGQNYLIDRYSFAGTLGARIALPKFLLKEQMEALIAGLSIPSPSLNDTNAPADIAPLPQVRAEVEDVRNLTKSSVTLLDKEFTSKNFKEKVNKTKFNILHISTHGQFSSDPLRTGFLAYDRQINIAEFESLLKNRSQISSQAIELLVLSACQTAKGNKRSALGIAGVAVQAGARSTVASLWLVEAESTVLLMQEFYRGLNNGLTKAEALRQAQLSLKANPKYSHPYFWSPFILVGSWL